MTGVTDSSNFPTTAGAFQTSLAGSANAFVAKIGPADSPRIAFGPGALTFANQNVGTSSSTPWVTLTAAGSQPLDVTSITVSDNFALVPTGTCPYSGGTVPSGTTCFIDVNFLPPSPGTFSGSVSVTDNASGSPQTIALTGTAAGPPGGHPLSNLTVIRQSTDQHHERHQESDP
jgi:hypothetical protein